MTGTTAKKMQDDLGTTSSARKQRPKNEENYLKDTGDNLRGHTTGKTWDNLSIKINDDDNNK